MRMNRKNFVFLTIIISFLILGVFSHEHYDDEPEEDEDELALQVVTYGSIIKLVSDDSGFRLHSHEINYGSGSGQQSVTGFPGAADSNSYWLIKSPHGHPHSPQGTVVRHGDRIRLQHVTSGKNLHSHNHKPPLTPDGYEVSAYGDNGNGDLGDNWVVEVNGAKGKKIWERKDHIRLKNEEMNSFLFSSKTSAFNRPIAGQLEVKALNKKSSATLWHTEEGIFFEAKLSPEDIKALSN